MLGCGAIATAIAVASSPISTAAAAGARVTFQCVSIDANNCNVTVPLTSNMDEGVTSTMPDSHPWQLNIAGGKGPAHISNTAWNGSHNYGNGTVWTATVTTSANEPSGSKLVLTFGHVTPIAGAKPYSSIAVSAPATAATGKAVKIFAVVKPVPATGHLVLQRQVGASWANVTTFAYSAKTKRWSATFVWPYPKHSWRIYHVLATAARGLLTTAGGSFKIATA